MSLLTTTVEGHTASAGKVVLLNALLFDGLLRNDVAGAKEDGGGDGLGEKGPCGQPGLVPVSYVSAILFGEAGSSWCLAGAWCLGVYSPPEHLECGL